MTHGDSFLKMPKWLLAAPGLTYPGKLLLLLLDDYQHSKLAKVQPRIDTIAQKLGVHRATIDRGLAKLRELGLVEVTWRQRASEYTVAPRVRWPGILIQQNAKSELNPDLAKCGDSFTQNAKSEPTLSINHQELLIKNSGVVPTPPQNPVAQNGHARPEKRTAAAAVSPTVKQAKNGTEPEPARVLVSELLRSHPSPGQPQKAIVVATKLLHAALDAALTANKIRTNHAAWCAFWSMPGPPGFVPHLWRWLDEGEWEFPPSETAIKRKTAQSERRKTRLEEMIENA